MRIGSPPAGAPVAGKRGSLFKVHYRITDPTTVPPGYTRYTLSQ